MRKLIEAAVKNPMIVNIMLIVIIGAGMISLSKNRAEVFPNFSLDIVLVQIPFPGASAEEVEEGVVIKVEESVKSISGVDYIESKSSDNYGIVQIYLKTDVADPRKVMEDVKDKVEQITAFPDDAEEPIINLFEYWEDTIFLSLYGEVSELSLKTMAEEVRDEMLDLPEVSRVDYLGLLPREIVIELSEENMQRNTITFQEVVRAVKNHDLDISGGTIKTREEDLNLRASAKNYRPEGLEEVPLRSHEDGRRILIGDVAEVREDFEDANYSVKHDGKPAILLVVKKTETDDALKLTSAVKRYVDQKRPSISGSVKLEYWADLSVFLKQRLSTLVRNGIMAVFIIFAILMVFLGYRLSFWVAVGLPISLMGTMILLKIQNITINMMSLFGFILVLGIMVDDAIVVSENIKQKLEAGESPIDAAINGTVEVVPAVTASVLTTIAAFSPMLFISGMWGVFMYPMASVLVFALLVSLFESFFILPAHLAHSLRPAEETQGQTGLMHRLREKTDNAIQTVICRTYKPVVKKSMRYRWQIFVLGFALFFVAVGVVRGGLIKFVFFPDIDGNYITASYTLEPGSSMQVQESVSGLLYQTMEQANEEFTEKRNEMLSDPGKMRKLSGELGPDTPFVLHAVTFLGTSQEGGTNPKTGQVFVELIKDESRGIPTREFLNRWRELAGDIPGVEKLTFDASTGPPGTGEVEVMLTGADLDELISAADLVKTKMREYPGTYEILDDVDFGNRELSFRLKDRGKALGLTLGDLATQVRYGFYGYEIHRVQRGRDEIKVWVRYPKEGRDGYEDLEAIKIRTPAGVELPLSEVAEFSTERQLRSISRYNRKRLVSVKCRVNADMVTPEELKASLREDLPAVTAGFKDVSFSFESFANRAQMQMAQSMGQGFMLALVAIFFIIAIVFRNYLHSFMIMLLIPLGFVGSVVGHLVVPVINTSIDRLDLSMLSLMGIVALAGIIVNDSIVMIDTIKRNLGSGQGLYEAVFNGAISRFRPIVLTTLTTSLGIMPLIMEPSLQARFLIPMAATIAFGLLMGTFFTQIWLPCMFLVFNDIKRVWYLMATGKLYEPVTVELNCLPDGNFIEGLYPKWLWGAVVAAVLVAVIRSGF